MKLSFSLLCGLLYLNKCLQRLRFGVFSVNHPVTPEMRQYNILPLKKEIEVSETYRHISDNATGESEGVLPLNAESML